MTTRGFSVGSAIAARSQRGYVLVATLIALALLALLAGRLAARMDALRGQSQVLQGLAEGTLAAENARARLLHAMATEPITVLGFGTAVDRRLRVDGEPFVRDGVEARLQDHRGLASLNAPDRLMLSRLMVAQGIAPGRVDTLLDTLDDYTDTDSLRRLNGAEAAEYEALGLPLPRNDWLSSAEEARQIVGWRDEAAALDRLLPLLSSRRDGEFNPNSAPRELLMTRAVGASPAQIDAFISLRRIVPFMSAAEAFAVTGLLFPAGDLFHPSDFYRLRLRPSGQSWALEYNILITPDGRARPWHIVDSRTVFDSVGTDDRGRRTPGPGVAGATPP